MMRSLRHGLPWLGLFVYTEPVTMPSSYHHIVRDIPCPVCGDPLNFPFSRYSGPVSHIHNRAHRLIVTPDPSGHQHKARVVPSGIKLEDALEQALAAA